MFALSRAFSRATSYRRLNESRNRKPDPAFPGGVGDTFTATFSYGISDLYPETEVEYYEYEPDYNE